ncbi:MAG: MFS transporter [Chloroflexi bacterium]|nr:MAG: MFS transporter [Chloroflexota bacterium]
MHDPYRALRFRDFRLMATGTFLVVLGEQMFTYAIGWELYERTNAPLALGLVGLLQVIPIFLLTLPAGHVADIFNRKRIIMLAQSILLFCYMELAFLSYTRGSLILVYSLILLMGIMLAFANPASSALVAQTLPEEAYENAATWNTSAWQLSSVIGPALGGVLVVFFHGAISVYLANALLAMLYILVVFFIRGEQKPRVRSQDETTLHSLAEGVRFLTRTQVLLAAITLDMFAMSLGPIELGWLRSAQSIGAICMALILLHRPPFQRAGRALLLAVIGFGLATIIFGLSHLFWLSLVMLFLLGGLDNISVIIRATLLLVRTPNEMRGRVSAINTLFLGASNQLGDFESGLTAQLFGPVWSVVGGGLGTILVVLLVAWFVPELRRMTTLHEDT